MWERRRDGEGEEKEGEVKGVADWMGRGGVGEGYRRREGRGGGGEGTLMGRGGRRGRG